MITSKRTNSDNRDFRNSLKSLNIDLKIRDGEEHSFYAQFNKIDKNKYAMLLTTGTCLSVAVIKDYSEDTMEVKRMYVPPERRGQGIASVILKETRNLVQRIKL